MQERVIKIILPEEFKDPALELLEADESIFFWLEESNSTNVVISILVDSGQTEKLMDNFERRFGRTENFKLIVLPVEASLPRKKEEEKPEPESEVKTKQKKSTRISREELYADIVGSTKMTNIYLIFVVLSTIVAAIGLMKNNVAVIIGAMVIAPFLGPSVALALSTTLGDNKLRNDALKATIAGFSLVIFLSALIGYFFAVDPSIPEIASRTQAGIPDILLALASAYVLFNFYKIATETIHFHSPRSGKLLVDRLQNGEFSMDFPADELAEVDPSELLLKAFNKIPLKTFKGKTDYLLIFQDQEDIETMKPDLSIISKIDARGIIISSKGRDVDFVSRFFGPLVGVDEDPVTGSAHTTLIPYWSGVLNNETLTAQQLSQRGGRLNCRFLGDRVKIAGKAVPYMIGEIDL